MLVVRSDGTRILGGEGIKCAVGYLGLWFILGLLLRWLSGPFDKFNQPSERTGPLIMSPCARDVVALPTNLFIRPFPASLDRYRVCTDFLDEGNVGTL